MAYMNQRATNFPRKRKNTDDYEGSRPPKIEILKFRL